MKWNRTLAIPELLFVGKNDTIVNANPHKFIEYKMQNMKNNNPFTLSNTLLERIVTIILVTKLITI
jgi:hypothetical protein